MTGTAARCSIRGCDSPRNQGSTGLCARHARTRDRLPEIELMREILQRSANLPRAACKNRTEWDATSIADRETAIKICLNECVELGRCRRWVAGLGKNQRLFGVIIAGRFRTPKPPQPMGEYDHDE